MRGHGKGGSFEDGGSDVNQSHAGGDPLDGLVARQLHQQRDVNGLVVEKDAVGVFSVGAETPAVVGGDDDQRVVEEFVSLEGSDQPGDRGVGGGNGSVISGGRGGQRVNEVNPEKQRQGA